MGKFDSYKIDLRGMREVNASYDWCVDNEFFAHIDGPEVQKGKVMVSLEVHRSVDVYEMNFAVDGTVVVICDRCLDEMDLDIHTTGKLQVKLGADYAFDPSAPDFVEQVRAVTKGQGVRATIEVTGVSAAMKQALQCASWRGRVSLLGCTRVSDCAVDYYQQVHCPGVKLIGAHNFVRPKVDSFPHNWTHQDDCKAILDLISAGRIQVAPIVSRIVAPEDAPEIYNQLCDDPKFPMGTVFDWRNIS